ncbi:IS110 family transposase [Microbispora sp. H13382]|uniref:IS110 family transposase n=1 Tax=Microbispora sp. H13382 TaxID=2729112 RepID=UPI001601C21E|nr:IS110 family transposase [Microbispora sp. H13382]
MARNRKMRIIGGVDTHGSTHHAAVILMSGRRLADQEFPATPDGYADLLRWMRGFGRLAAVGVEGTGAYGAGLSRYLHQASVKVVDVDRPDRKTRRHQGKSDPIDAYAAAEATLAGRASTVPKTRDGLVEVIRMLHVTRASAVKARAATINQLKTLLVTAPADLREQLRDRSSRALVEMCLRLRPGDQPSDPTTAAKYALRSLARRHRQLTEEISDLDAQLRPLITKAAPRLLARRGIGFETAAQLLITVGDNPDRLTSEAAFAHLVGVAPIPASSGQTRRHRLNRGGDRDGNRALHVIVVSRMAHCPTTMAYVQRRTTEGLSKKEIIRCLKRYVAREVYKDLITPDATPQAAVQAA